MATYNHPFKQRVDRLQESAQHAASYGQEAKALQIAAKAASIIGTIQGVKDAHLIEHLEEIAEGIETGMKSFKSKGAPVAIKSAGKEEKWHSFTALGRDSTGCRVKE